jgi:hypothetical protein
MFDSYHDEAAAYEAAEEARRVELEAISDSEGQAGYDGDWAERDAAMEDAHFAVEAAELEAADDWADEDLPF